MVRSLGLLDQFFLRILVQRLETEVVIVQVFVFGSFLIFLLNGRIDVAHVQRVLLRGRIAVISICG